jgi:hypothetical protein
MIQRRNGKHSKILEPPRIQQAEWLRGGLLKALKFIVPALSVRRQSSGGSIRDGVWSPHLLYFGQEPLIAGIVLKCVRGVPQGETRKPATTLGISGVLQCLQRFALLP